MQVQPIELRKILFFVPCHACPSCLVSLKRFREAVLIFSSCNKGMKNSVGGGAATRLVTFLLLLYSYDSSKVAAQTGKVSWHIVNAAFP